MTIQVIIFFPNRSKNRNFTLEKYKFHNHDPRKSIFPHFLILGMILLKAVFVNFSREEMWQEMFG